MEVKPPSEDSEGRRWIAMVLVGVTGACARVAAWASWKHWLGGDGFVYSFRQRHLRRRGKLTKTLGVNRMGVGSAILIERIAR
jgi:hypothetical protein